MSDNPPSGATGVSVQSFVAEIVSSYVKKNPVAPADMPALIATVYQSLMSVGKPPEAPPKEPAVPIRRSVTPNAVVWLECGRRGHMLRRHVQDKHGLSPEQYRAKWKLPPDHPLTAPAYSQRRSALAKQLGLGRGTARRGRTRRQARASA